MENTIDHIQRDTTIRLSPSMVRAAKLHSKKLSGCPRPNEGSLNHFAMYAFQEAFKKFGLDYPKQVKEYYIEISIT